MPCFRGCVGGLGVLEWRVESVQCSAVVGQQQGSGFLAAARTVALSHLIRCADNGCRAPEREGLGHGSA